MFDDDFEVGQPMYPYAERHQDVSHGFAKVLGEIPLQITAELGRTKLSVSDILKLQVGSVVELDKMTSEAMDIRVNSKLIARGEVVRVDDYYGVRIHNVLGRRY